VLPLSNELVDPRNRACHILGNELTDSREHGFVAAVVVELGKKIVEANLGIRAKVPVIQLNLSDRSLKNPTTPHSFSEFDCRPYPLQKWLYPGHFFRVTGQSGLKGPDYSEVFECLE
jgi:hypothetical protein